MNNTWGQRSACKSYHYSELDWFSSDAAEKHKAKIICQTQCPVRRECLEQALTYQDRFGIWGGVDEFELRRAMACDQFGDPAPDRSRPPRCPFCLSHDLKITASRTKKGHKASCNDCDLTWRMLAIPDGYGKKSKQ